MLINQMIQFNNIYHRPMKMQSSDVKCSIDIDFDIENNNRDLKSKVGDYVRISKYNSILQVHTGQTTFLPLKIFKQLCNLHMLQNT